MTSSQSIKPGDEVRVLMRISRRGAQVPEDGYQGTVTKTGRKYATAAFEETWTNAAGSSQSRKREISFDMESGIEHAGYEGWYVRTPEQFHLDKRRKMALFLLGESGIEFKFGRERSLTLEQIEALAEVVKTWEG